MSFFNTYFDNIYCLNLKIRKNKWHRSKSRLDKYEISCERFDASSFQSPNVISEFNRLVKKYPREEDRRNKALIKTPGAMGCLMSHIRILKDAKRKGYKKILILEDDFIFAQNFEKIFKRKIQMIPHWKLLYLGGTQHCWKSISPKNGFYTPLNTCGTFAYALDSTLYDEVLLDYKKKLHPVDHCLILGAQRRHEKDSFVFFPNIVIADLTSSDIRTPRDQGLYDKRLRWNMIPYERNMGKHG